jgi:two-component system, OmpR family, sensor histidine kinase TctE
VTVLSRGRQSLTTRLLLVLVTSLTVVAILLGAGGAWFSHGVAQQTGDRVLKSSARAIAETLAVEGDEITLDLPAAAFGMLESDARDNIYYNIRHDGVLLTGYPDFPAAPVSDVLDDTHFRYETYRNARVRVATEVRRLPRIDGLVIIQVAETLDERNALVRRMLLALTLLEGAFILMAGLLVWPAVSWSLRPVTRLRNELEARTTLGADFTPLGLEAVPAELGGLVTGFNALLGRLEQAVSGMRRFTADASHQMRTPLAVLRTHVAVLRKHGSTTAQGEASLEDIEAAIERLRRLLTQLIALARAEESLAGAAPIQTFHLDEVATEVARQLAPSALEHQVEVHFEDHGGRTPIRGNPVLTGEIVANILENAIRYNRPGGNVTVRILNDGAVPCVEIEDDGPGIPPKDRERVFQRFHRLSRDQGSLGSGLGLPIVQTLAKAVGAELSLASGPGGRGLKVSVSFPGAI